MQQHPPDLYYIRILEDGSFDNVQDKSLYVTIGSTVRVILTLRSSEMDPLVLVQRKGDTKRKEKTEHVLKEQLFGSREVALPIKSLTRAQLKTQFQTREFSIDAQGDYYVEVQFQRSGSQFFRLIYFKNDQIVKLGVPNFFIVQPHTALESITIQTVLPYSLGPFELWKQQLESQINIGYKAFHFPPIQKLGESGSLYSISNQHELNPNLFHDVNVSQLTAFFEEMHNQHGTLFFIDILLNHTAFDSEWLGRTEFKDATYNQDNTPQLNCAIELDQAIASFSNALGNKQVGSYPFGNKIMDEEDLSLIMNILENEIVAPLNLHEYFKIDIEQIIQEIQGHLKTKKLLDTEKELEEDEDDDNIFIKNPRELFKYVMQGSLCNEGAKRNGVTFKFQEVLSFLNEKEHHKKVSVEYLRSLLNKINDGLIKKAYSFIKEALNSTRGQIRWSKIENQNHTIQATYKGDSLVPRYFTKLQNGMWAANNGWIQDYDPLKNFAETDEHHYFRRSIIIWGDLVKLRYGTCKQESPHLWKFMKKYVKGMAKMFHGLRLDNAHSTPLNLGGYMMRKARQADQNLLVFAELFSGSSYNDSIFTKQLGLNALVREVNRIKDGQNMNQTLHFYSGSGKWAVGSLPMLTEVYGDQHYTLLRSQYAPALIYEQSHDNESLIESHGFKHQLPIAALVAFSKCMKGTVRGYDQYLQKRLCVVTERRHYTLPCGTTTEYKDEWGTKIHSSLEPIRMVLSETSHDLEESYPYIYVGNHYNSLVQINRFSQDFLRSRVVIAQPEFKQDYKYPFFVELPGIIQNIDYIFQNKNNISFSQQDDQLLPAHLEIIEHRNLNQYCEIEYDKEKRVHILKFTDVPKSLVIILSCAQEVEYQSKIISLSQINYSCQSLYSKHFQNLSSNDIHFLLFSSEQEELELTQQGLFDLPNYGKLVYAGFSGSLQPLMNACKNNNLGHSLCENLRKGDWLIDYLTNRIQKLQGDTSKSLQQFIQETSELIKQAPRYLIPQYFAKYVIGISQYIMNVVQHRAVPWVKTGPFFRQLAIANYQFVAQIPSSQFDNYKTSMSAGHPHFSTGWCRVWGRDTFIAFKGCLLLTGMIEEAHEIILEFASCLRHGLLPNLLDAGNNCRYNNRDACWWFIRAIKDYIEFTGDTKIWNEKIQMRFQDNDQDRHYAKQKEGKILTMKLQEVVQNIMESHANGIQFREWRAGKEIDQQMESEGFNISLKMDEDTGFIIGGNYRNCLTWMDKMGSSEQAGNKGFPATSRDGAPIEMTALLKCALDFLYKQNQAKFYDYEGITMKNQKKLSFKQWSDFITLNFEKSYWIPKDPDQFPSHNIIEKYVRHKQIYKDLSRSSKPRSDYQLRPNACIAIAIAPELFNKTHAQLHLATTEAALIEQNSLGIKTLDKIASEYSSFYDNGDHSDNFTISQGFSYHNGPEWVWVYGYYLKALTAIYSKVESHVFYSYLANHKKYIQDNEWFSLPEITNGNGESNYFSCKAQAWSIAVILESISDFHNNK